MRAAVLIVATAALALPTTASAAVPRYRTLLIAGGPASRAAGAVSGRVKEQGSGQPVAGAAVTIDGTQLGTISDDSGRYRIAGVPEGSRNVSARRIGYAASTVTVIVTSGDVTANFALIKSVQQLQAVV